MGQKNMGEQFEHLKSDEVHNDAQNNVIVLSAGGTGGHMTPALALGHDLASRGFEVVLLTDERGCKFQSMFEKFPYHIVKAGTLGRGLVGKIKGMANLGIGILQAGSILKNLKPKVVIGFGGYPSFPGVYAAQKMGVATIIHEQNAIIGKANAYLAPRAERIAVSMAGTSGLEKPDEMRCVVTGNPVRPDVSALYSEPYPAMSADGELRILIMGGSLGAQIFSDVIPETLAGLSASYKSRLRITQQCREDDLDRVQKIYDDAEIACDLSTFFDDVPELLKDTHLVIGRSGASTVAEVTTAGRPAIFVPYPHHKDQQQKMNADAVADAGGAWVMNEQGFTRDALQARLESFLQNPEVLFKAAEKSRSCGKPDAARKLGNLVTALASGWN